MQHTCQDCDHQFFVPGQSEDSVSPAAQCPNCHSYRTQPPGIPDESNEMLHGQMGMPTSTLPDSSGNPLGEGILASALRCEVCRGPLNRHGECLACGQGGTEDLVPEHPQMPGNALQTEGIPDGGWKNRDVRDESFASSVRRYSLFETPEFETTELIAPPDLYRHGMETEAAHRAGIQIPKGITDNLHATLGNLGAWVENPYENGELRPYHNKYWSVIRPSFMTPGTLQIGVADPTMAEIINHVAQTDDLSPLYQYRGKQAHTKTAGPAALALLPEAGELLGGAAAAGEAAGAAGGGAAAAGAGASEAAAGAAGAGADAIGASDFDIAQGLGKTNLTGPSLDAARAALSQNGLPAAGAGGIMKSVMQGVPGGAGRGLGMNLISPVLNYADDFLGLGQGGAGAGGGSGGAGGGGVNDASFYSRIGSDEDDAHPDSHDEIPKQEDGDYKQQDDGNHHEWQRDISVDQDGGGAQHAPSFQSGGAAFERFLMMAPLLMQLLQSGGGAEDPMVQGLHHSLDSEIPGYLDHADDGATQHMIMLLSPGEKSKAEPEKNDGDHTDENAGGKHEARLASIVRELEQLGELRRGLPADVDHQVDEILRYQGVFPALQFVQQHAQPQQLPMQNQAMPYMSKTPTLTVSGADFLPDMEVTPPFLNGARMAGATMTDEQQAAVQQYFIDNAQELGVDEDGLKQILLDVLTNPYKYMDILAKIQQREGPPEPPDAGMSANPPMPAQENAPPEATMPMPGMSQQMMGAVERYAADSVATVCPHCGSHTTELLGEDGTSHCHACDKTFKTEGKTPSDITNQSSLASTWNVDKDLHKEADAGSGTTLYDDGPSSDTAQAQGVPIADQTHQRDIRKEQDSGHTWTDEDSNPLKVGQEYEMYTQGYDIPDLVRVEAIKPTSIVLTYTGEFGLEHQDELTKEEANIDGTSFRSTTQEGELGPDDSLEHNDDDNTDYSGEPEHRDISAPTGLVASVIASGVHTQANPALSWLTKGMGHSAGANYTPMEQRALIEEAGTARNADMLDLSGTHYIQDAEEAQFLFGV